MNSAVILALGVLADGTPRNTGPDFGKASPVGLAVVVLLLIATFLLVWSMNRHLRKLPTSFERADAADTPEPDHPLDEDPTRESGG
jgi:hypothetical protein